MAKKGEKKSIQKKTSSTIPKVAKKKPAKEKAEIPLVKQKGVKSPPAWYLYAIIVLNIITPFLDHLIFEGHNLRQHFIYLEQFIIIGWIIANFIVLWYLFRKKAKSIAFVLPMYFIVLLVFIWALTYYLSHAGLATNTELMSSLYYWLLIPTTIFEIGGAFAFLKMRKEHARS